MFGGGIFGVGGGTLGTLGAEDAEAGEALRPRPTIHDIMATSKNSPAGTSFQRQKPQAAAIPDPYAIVSRAQPPTPPAPVAVTRTPPPLVRAASLQRAAGPVRPAGVPARPTTPVVPRAPMPSQMPATPGGVVRDQMPATPGGVVRPGPTAMKPPPPPMPSPTVAKPLKGFGVEGPGMPAVLGADFALQLLVAGAVGYAVAPKKHKTAGALAGLAVPYVFRMFRGAAT